MPNRPPKVGDVWGKGNDWWLIVWIDRAQPHTAHILHVCNHNYGFVDGTFRIWTFGQSWKSHELKFNIFESIDWSHIAEEIEL